MQECEMSKGKIKTKREKKEKYIKGYDNICFSWLLLK